MKFVVATAVYLVTKEVESINCLRAAFAKPTELRREKEIVYNSDVFVYKRIPVI